MDEDKKIVAEIAFRVDARKVSPEVVRRICKLATDLRCVFMTSEYEVLVPDESMVLANVNRSTAKKFVDDPVSTLLGLNQQKMQEPMNRMAKKGNPRQ